MATDLQLLSKKARRRAALAEAGLEKSASFDVLYSNMSYIFSDILNEQQLSETCDTFIQNEINTLFVPLLAVPYVSKRFSKEKIKVGAIIDYPLAGLPPSLKQDAILWAAKNGADVIVVLIRSDVMHQNSDHNELRQALISYRNVLPFDFPLYFAFNSYILSEEEIITFARYSEIARASGIICIKYTRQQHILQNIALLRSASPDTMSVGFLGNSKSWQEIETLNAAGADMVITCCQPDLFRYPSHFKF